MNGAFLGASQGIVNSVAGMTGLNVFNAAAIKPGVVLGLQQSLHSSFGNEGPSVKQTFDM